MSRFESSLQLRRRGSGGRAVWLSHGFAFFRVGGHQKRPNGVRWLTRRREINSQVVGVASSPTSGRLGRVFFSFFLDFFGFLCVFFFQFHSMSIDQVANIRFLAIRNWVQIELAFLSQHSPRVRFGWRICKKKRKNGLRMNSSCQ